MSLRRVLILIERELVRGSKSFLFLFVLVVPFFLTLVVNLVFGTLFSGKPRLGLAAAGGSRLAAMAREIDSLVLREYNSEEALKQATSVGAVDFGLAVPAGFEQEVISGEPTELKAYVWGESLLKNRVIVETAVVVMLRTLSGQQAPVEIVSLTIGDGESVPWEDRLLPLVVMMTILLSGLIIPSTSLVEEKQKRTLQALTITSATTTEVYAAKALSGILVSSLMGVVILAINRAFGAHPEMILALVVLGAVMAAEIGVLMGVLVKDISTLFATFKSMGILLYAPAFVYMFPEIPQWIGRIFPTYYMISPLIDVSQRGASWPDIAPEVLILLALIAALILAIILVDRRKAQQV